MRINVAEMKNKMKKGTIGILCAGSTAFVAMLPMTVFAQVPEAEDQICICETKCDEEHINEDCPVCSCDYSFCEGSECESEENGTEAVTEEPMGPLTPDGNLTLVDDYGSIEAGEKQFITVVTKSGNYFYIIIDRDDKGTETVHFLNMVDESDLLALMDDEQVEEYMNKTGVAGETEPEITEEEPTEDTEEPESVEEEPQKKNNAGILLIVFVVLAGGGAGYVYFKKTKEKKPVSQGVDPDADYSEDEEDYLDSISSEEMEIPEETEDEILEQDDDSEEE